MSWEDRAACRDRPDLSWFPVAPMGRGPKSEHHDAVAAAIAVCRSCPVINECREAGRTESGIWGGEYHTEEATRKALAALPKPIQHGTASGYRHHYRRQEEPCEACVEANKVYQAEKRERTLAYGAAYREARALEKAAEVRRLLGRSA